MSTSFAAIIGLTLLALFINTHLYGADKHNDYFDKVEHMHRFTERVDSSEDEQPQQAVAI